jgi:hypothetical protein
VHIYNWEVHLGINDYLIPGLYNKNEDYILSQRYLKVLGSKANFYDEKSNNKMKGHRELWDIVGFVNGSNLERIFTEKQLKSLMMLKTNKI